MADTPAGLDQFLQGSNVAPGQPAQNAEPPGLNDFVKDQVAQDTHGGLGQQALAAVEGAGRGVTLGGSDLLANAMRSGASKLGLPDKYLDVVAPSPEDRLERREANPVTEALSSMAGSGALAVGTGGIGAPAGAGYLGAAGASAAEGALMGAGNVVSDYALGDPDLTAQKAAAQIGMGAILGGGFGLAGKALGNVLGKGAAPELDSIASDVVGDSGHIKGTLSDEVVNQEIQDKTMAETQKAMNEKYGLKDNAPEIISAAKEIGAPVTEGMVSGSPWVQRLEDSLVNGAPTYSAIRKAKTYEAGYDAVEKAVTDIVGEPEAQGGLSKAQFGQAMEKSLASKISEENEPISKLYQAVKADTQSIPVKPSALESIADDIGKLPQVQLDSNAEKLLNQLKKGKDLEIFQTVDGVKSLRKTISDSLSMTPSFNEKSTLSEIQDSLKKLEEDTITKHAEGMLDSHAESLATASKAGQLDEMNIWSDKINRLQDLLSQKKQADELYKPFITKVKKLAGYFGKKRISGAQGAIDFITNDLTPESLANKVTTKGNSEFTKFFAKEFPNENELLKQYQKAQLREASINERTGDFNSRLFLKKTIGKNGLEPEQLENLFHPEELKKLNAAQTYLRSIPEDFNPSGTSHTEAMRGFFEHPVGAAVANARDFGIDTFIKNFAKLPPEARPDPLAAGQMLASKFNKFSAIQKMTQKTDEQISSGAASIFGKAVKGAALNLSTKSQGSFDDKAKRISELAMNPDALGQHLQNHTTAIEDVAPNISQSFQHGMVASVNFLNSKLPKAPPQFMLSHTWEPSDLQKQKFNQYYEAVQNPVGILKQVKMGSLTSAAMEAVDATHPALLQEMRQKVMANMDQAKAMKLPYSVKLSLAQFLGHPLDSSMMPSVAIANQATFNMPTKNEAQGNQPRHRSTQSGLSKLKLASRSKTETQDLEGNET